MTQYQTASEVKYWHQLFAKPIPIVAACNRVQRQNERAMGHEWWKGVAVALSAVLAALVVAWLVL